MVNHIRIVFSAVIADGGIIGRLVQEVSYLRPAQQLVIFSAKAGMQI